MLFAARRTNAWRGKDSRNRRAIGVSVAMLRHGLACATMAMLAIVAASARADETTYTALVEADHVHVRSGPGTGYYATEILRHGDRVEVCGHDAGGWCRVRPPAGSFSWVPAEAVALQRDGTARVVRHRTEAGVGSRFDERRDVVQVLLDRDETVELSIEQPPVTPGTEPTWYKITPPAGEFRWIHEQYLRPDATVGHERRSERIPYDTSSRAGDRVALVGYEDELAEPELLDEPRATRLPATMSEERPVSATLDDLELAVAALTAGRPVAKDAGALEAEAREAWRRARTASDRNRAEILVRRTSRLAGQASGVTPIPAEIPLVGSFAAVTQYLVAPVSSPFQNPFRPRAVATSPVSCGTPPTAPMYAAPPAMVGPAYSPPPPMFPYAPPGPRHYLSLDALGWWVQGDHVPALATTSPIGTPQTSAGVLGLPTTSVLFGNQTVNTGIRPGGRVQGGIWVDDAQTFAFEGHYYALATASTDYNATSTFGSGSTGTILARPFFNDNPAVNHASSLIVAFPGFMPAPPATIAVNVNGSIKINETSNIQSAGGGGRLSLSQYTSPVRFFLVGGYRFFNVAESLFVASTSSPPTETFLAGSRVMTSDYFATSNVFNGGDIGLGTELRLRRWWFGGETRVAMGNMQETLTVDGATAAIAGPFKAQYVGGLLTQASNIGTFTSNHFAVIPSVDLKLGYQVFPAMRLTVGYNFTWVSRVIRPGAQVDTTVNTSQVAGGTLVGPAHPQNTFSQSSLWLQGVTGGLEFTF
jgi:SH3-like domain-containing protein